MNINLGAIALAVSFLVGGAVVYSYFDTKQENSELREKVEELEAVNNAQDKSGEVKNDQTEAITKTAAATGKLNRDVAGLRKSVEQLKAESKDSIETCNRSLTVAGEVFGECTERYSEVAAKAERMKIDLTAMDKHAGILEGLASDLVGLEPLK